MRFLPDKALFKFVLGFCLLFCVPYNHCGSQECQIQFLGTDRGGGTVHHCRKRRWEDRNGDDFSPVCTVRHGDHNQVSYVCDAQVTFTSRDGVLLFGRTAYRRVKQELRQRLGYYIYQAS